MSIKNNQWSIKLARREKLDHSDEYLVLFAKNSTQYAPGKWLTREQVDALCENKYWDVTIVSHNDNK